MDCKALSWNDTLSSGGNVNEPAQAASDSGIGAFLFGFLIDERRPPSWPTLVARPAGRCEMAVASGLGSAQWQSRRAVEQGAVAARCMHRRPARLCLRGHLQAAQEPL